MKGGYAVRSIYYLISGIVIIALMLILNQFIEIADFIRGFCVGLGLSLGIYGLVAVIVETAREKKEKKEKLKTKKKK